MHADAETLRHPRAVSLDDPAELHRPLDPTLELDRLEPRAEHAGGAALEEALQESLQIGEQGHEGAGVYQRVLDRPCGPIDARRPGTQPPTRPVRGTNGVGRRYHGRRGLTGACVYSAFARSAAGSSTSIAWPGVSMTE